MIQQFHSKVFLKSIKTCPLKAYVQMFISALFIIAPQNRGNPTLNVVVHLTMEYYSAKKKKTELLQHETAWMNLKNTILSERIQTQKAMWCHLYEILAKIKLYHPKVIGCLEMRVGTERQEETFESNGSMIVGLVAHLYTFTH